MISNLIALIAHAKKPVEYVDSKGTSRPYVRLAGNLIKGDRLELSAVEPSPRCLIYFARSRREFIVHGDRFIYRYRNDGELLDLIEAERLSNRRSFYHSGVYFHESHYIDWELTADPQPKPYAENMSDDGLSETALNSLIIAADWVDYDNNTEEKTAELFLLKDSRWTKIVSRHLFPLSEYEERDPRRRQTALLIQERQRNVNQPVVRLVEDKQWNLNAKDSPLQVVRFDKQGRSRKSFMDINSHSWEGLYGHAYLKLAQYGDVLHFQIETARKQEFQPDLQAMHVRDIDGDTASVVFVALYDRSSGYRPADEIGLYLLRPISREPVRAVEDLTRLYNLRFEAERLLPRQGQWRELHFFNGQREMLGVEFSDNVAEKPRAIPSALFLYWKFSQEPKDKLIRVSNGNTAIRLRQTSGVLIGFYFDKSEMQQAFSILGNQSNISLKLEAEQFDIGDSITFSLENSKQKISLRRVTAEGIGYNEVYDDGDLDRLFSKQTKKP